MSFDIISELTTRFGLGIGLRYNINNNLQCELILYILKRYNPRISEILNANKTDIIGEKFLVLTGAKGSDNVIIHDEFLCSSLSKLPIFANGKIFNSSYNSIHRYIHTYYCDDIMVNSKGNNKVTHSYRYKNAQLFQKSKRVPDEIKSLLHHKSTKSQTYYLKGPNNHG